VVDTAGLNNATLMQTRLCHRSREVYNAELLEIQIDWSPSDTNLRSRGVIEIAIMPVPSTLITFKHHCRQTDEPLEELKFLVFNVFVPSKEGDYVFKMFENHKLII
jgi:hypothetical protein